MSRIWEAFLVCGLKGKRVKLAPSSRTIVTYKAKLVTKIQTIKGFLGCKEFSHYPEGNGEPSKHFYQR